MDLVAHDFPDGTTVDIYPAEQLPEQASSPVGARAAQAVVSGGRLSLDGLGLPIGRRYVGWALGRGWRFYVGPGSLDRKRVARLEDIDSADAAENAVSWHNIREPIGVWAGVKGDGSDETDLINAHTAACRATGTPVYWPWTSAGYGARSLVLDTGDVWFTAPAGRRAQIRMVAGAAAGGDVSLLDQANDAALSDVCLAGLRFYGNRAANNHGNEFVRGLALETCTDVTVVGCEFRHFRGDGIRVGRNAAAATRVKVRACDFYDCGIKEAGDGGNLRMGVAFIAGTDCEVSSCYFETIGAVAIDLEANSASDLFTGVAMERNRFGTGIASFFINVAPSAATVVLAAANAVGIVIRGNRSTVGTPPRGFAIRATAPIITDNFLWACVNIAVWLMPGTTDPLVEGNTCRTTANAGTAAPIYLDGDGTNGVTGAAVEGNACLGGFGNFDVEERPGSNDNKIGPNRTTKAVPYLRSGSRTVLSAQLRGEVGWNPPSVAAGAQTTQTVTVTGAAIGDAVAAGFSNDLQGMQLTGYVSAADTVTLVLRNGTAGAIDLANGTVKALVAK